MINIYDTEHSCWELPRKTLESVNSWYSDHSL